MPDPTGQADKSRQPPGAHHSAVRFLFGYDIFISYSRADGADYANGLYSRFSDRGYAVFLDRHEGLYGDELKGRLKGLLTRSKAMVLVATRQAFESPHVAFELDTFAKVHAAKPRPLIPIGTRILRNACPREDIGRRVWVEEASSDSLPAMPSDTAIESIGGRLVARKREGVFRNVLASASLIFLAIAVIAVWQWQRARVERDRAEQRAKEALAGKLIAESNQLREDRHSIPISALLAIEAASVLESADSNAAPQESNAALQQALRLLPTPAGGYSVGSGNFSSVKVSASGDVFLALEAGGARICKTGSSACVRLQLPEPSWTAFSRDGRRLATADRNRVRVWEVSDGRVLFESVLEPCNPVFAFRPSGNSLAIGCGEQINLLNIETAQRATIFVGRPVTVLHFNTAEQLIAVAGTQLEMRDAASGELLRTIELGLDFGDDFETAVDAAGKYFAVLMRQTMHLAHRSSEVHVWSLETGDQVAGASEPTPAGELSFSPNGKYLAMLLARGSHQTEPRVSVAVYDVLENRLLMKGSHRSSVSTLSFSADETRVATASEDKTAIVWNIEDGLPLAVTSHDSSVLAAFFRGDLLHTFSDGKVDAWDTAGGQAWADFRQLWGTDVDLYAEIVRGMGFNHQGRFISYGTDGLLIWNPDGRIIEGDLPGDSRRRMFFLGRRRALSAYPSGTNTVSVVDALAGRPIAQLVHTVSPAIIGFAEDGAHVVTLAGGTLVRWNVDSGKPEGTATAPAFWTSKSPNSSFVLKGRTMVLHQANRIVIVDFEQQRTLELPAIGDSVEYDLSADGRRLTTLYKRERGALLGVRQQPRWTPDTSLGVTLSRPLEGWIRFFPDASRLALFGSDEHLFRVFEVPDLQEVVALRQMGAVREVAFSSDGALLATACEDGQVLVWDLAGNRVLSRFRHDAAANTVSFLPERGYVLSGGDDRTARIWELSRNREIWRAEHRGPVVRTQVSPDGRYIATAADSTIGELLVHLGLWKTPDLKDQACSRLTRNLSADEWNLYVSDGPVRRTCPKLRN